MSTWGGGGMSTLAEVQVPYESGFDLRGYLGIGFRELREKVRVLREKGSSTTAAAVTGVRWRVILARSFCCSCKSDKARNSIVALRN